MKKVLLTAAAVSMLFAAPFASYATEQDVDVAKITCKEFLEAKNNMPMMLMWIDGYMSGKSDNTVISDAWMEKLGMHLGTYCGKNPGKTIMDAMEAMPAE